MSYPIFFLDNKTSGEILDEALKMGGNQSKSVLRIAAHFMLDAGDDAEFLKNEYRYGAKGILHDNEKYAVWFDENGIDNDKQFERHIENGGLFGIEKEDWMKYLENGEYLRAAEISTEQNYNMIDGRRNNIETPKVAKPDNEKTSLLERLKEKQQLLISGAKKEDKEKKSERDLP